MGVRYRTISWRFGIGDFDSTISTLESLSTVSVSVLGELKDKKLRSVVDNGIMTRTEA